MARPKMGAILLASKYWYKMEEMPIPAEHITPAIMEAVIALLGLMKYFLSHRGIRIRVVIRAPIIQNMVLIRQSAFSLTAALLRKRFATAQRTTV